MMAIWLLTALAQVFRCEPYGAARANQAMALLLDAFLRAGAFWAARLSNAAEHALNGDHRPRWGR